ncbi:MAG: hypothetical protein BWY78_00836 [Alphaproteobacteria bacterium ADurb.Bin438]|nr:MAG: hypothetical protein BWY78_00836 [Alphaproteobacteria bacterium ADurb.Bin438]
MVKKTIGMSEESLNKLVEYFKYNHKEEGFIKNLPELDLNDLNSEWFFTNLYKIYEKVRGGK